jgi:hypothetical protein
MGPKGRRPFLSASDQRQSGKRRKKYDPKHDTQVIPANNNGEIVFFQNAGIIDRLSNIKQAGMVNVHESFRLFRILPLLWDGTPEAEQVAVRRQGTLELQVQGDLAYRLLLSSLNPGHGWTGNTSMSQPGFASFRHASSVGKVTIGAGQNFDVRLKWPQNGCNTQNRTLMTCLLEQFVDQPIT